MAAGDVDALAPLLDPEVELIDAGEEAIIATRTATVPDGPAAGLRPATLITSEGKAVTMRQFRDRSEALAAAQ